MTKTKYTAEIFFKLKTKDHLKAFIFEYPRDVIAQVYPREFFIGQLKVLTDFRFLGDDIFFVISHGDFVRCHIPITTTPCHYGGVRYWFTCIGIRNGAMCGKRVSVLYGAGNVHFRCRHCYNLTYESRNTSGIFKKYPSVTPYHLERALSKVKRKFYNRKPTKNYLRYLRLKKREEKALLEAYASLHNLRIKI